MGGTGQQLPFLLCSVVPGHDPHASRAPTWSSCLRRGFPALAPARQSLAAPAHYAAGYLLSVSQFRSKASLSTPQDPNSARNQLYMNCIDQNPEEFDIYILIDFFSSLKHPQAATEVEMCLLLIATCAPSALRQQVLPLLRSPAFVSN